MQNFITYIKQFSNFTIKEVQTIENHLKVVSLRENEYFFKAGNYAQQVGFIEKGIARVFDIDEKGNEIVRYFLRENQFMVDLDAYTNNTIGTLNIQVLSDCEITLITKTAYDYLSKEIDAWSLAMQKITQKVLLEKLENRSQLVSQDATIKYLDFMKNNPELANRIPLGHLASYLGIKQQSLSRIRKKIAQNNAF